MASDDINARSRTLLRDAMGLKGLDHPQFERVDQVWRAVFYPAFHDVVAITVSDLGVGGWVEVRAADATLRAATRQWAGQGGGSAWVTQPSAPGVWESTVKGELVDQCLGAMPKLPLHNEPTLGRDGLWIEYEVKQYAQRYDFTAWSPSPRRGALHHAIAVSLCRLAVATIHEGVCRQVVDALAPYLP